MSIAPGYGSITELRAQLEQSQADLAAARARVAELETYIENKRIETSVEMNAYRQRAERAESLLAQVDDHGDDLAQVTARAERAEADLAAARAERDAAFKMSRCECSADECCANLVKLHNDLAAARALLREANEMLAETIVCGPKLREYTPLRQRIVAVLAREKK